MSPWPTVKELKKLTAACRKAGISKFRHGDLEITLADEAPVSNYRKATASRKDKGLFTGPIIDENFQSDELSPEAMLFWSASGTPDETEGATE